MSTKYLNWAFQIEDLNPMNKIIVISLADNANDEGQSYPSTKSICRRTGIKSRTTLTKHIKELGELGVLSIKNRQRNNGSKTSNLYQLNIDYVTSGPCPEYEHGVVQIMDKGCPDNEHGVVQLGEHGVVQLGEHGVVQLGEHPEPPIEPPIEPITPIVPFEDFENAFEQFKIFALKNLLPVPRVFSATTKTRTVKVLKLLEAAGSNWAEYLQIIGNSPHLLGSNDRGWRIKFDWIVIPANFEKILNGNYLRQHSTQSGQRQKPLVQQIADQLRAEEAQLHSEMMGIGYEK